VCLFSATGSGLTLLHTPVLEGPEACTNFKLSTPKLRQIVKDRVKNLLMQMHKPSGVPGVVQPPPPPK